jgi:CheY-like chemotaxis protein
LPAGRRKLLVADDSPTVRKVVSLTFSDEGLEVVAAEDGEQALRFLEGQEPPDIVLADVTMPGPDGYALCERVKRDARLGHIPVVLLVGTFEPFNEAEARRVGADTVLTKPFQSIRDLVSKVGSLLGGGGSAAEPKDEAAPVARGPEAAAADVPSRPAEDLEAPDAARSHSFADFGADDELIEARPAEAFNAAPPDSPPARRRRTDEPAADAFGAAPSDFSAGTSSDFNASASAGARPFVESKDPDFFDSHFASDGDAAHSPSSFGAGGAAAEVFTLDDEESEAGAAADIPSDPTEDVFTAPTDVFTAPTRESVMHEQTPPQASSETNAAHAADTNAARAADTKVAHAATAAVSDDALLDLGQVGAPAAVATSAAADDDFILDLGFDDEPAAAPQPVVTPARPDAPSAFAEAAHGERQPSFAGAASSASASPSFAQAERASSAAAETDDAPWRDVVAQDGPRGFVFGAEEETEGGAPKGAVEPQVVPAEEPAPAAGEGEFTDGSVEGDRPKPPTGQSAQSFVGVASSPESGAAASASGASSVVPREPSTAGYAVAEGHTRVEEPLRADQLSREAVDAIARRVVELMSDRVVREIAWEVVPELAELLIKQKLEEDRRS